MARDQRLARFVVLCLAHHRGPLRAIHGYNCRLTPRSRKAVRGAGHPDPEREADGGSGGGAVMPDRGAGVDACRQGDCKIIGIIGVPRSVGR